jgi:hypothetical protein
MDFILEHSEKTILFNVFTFPFLSNTDCESILGLVKSAPAKEMAGSYQKHTVEVGGVLSELLYTRLLPTLLPHIRDLFNFGRETNYELYLAQVITYSPGPDGEKSLKLHVDDSDITVNIPLYVEDLEGSEVEFFGATAFGNHHCLTTLAKHQRKISAVDNFKIVPRQGLCILHRGSHPHQTHPIRAGTRKTLILWLKSI